MKRSLFNKLLIKFFCKFTREYKVIIFPKLKLYVESPVVKKCFVTNCSTDHKTGQKKASPHFHEDQELKWKWIYFVNRKDWLPTAHSVICIHHFEERFIKRCKKMSFPVLWQLHPVPPFPGNLPDNEKLE